MVRAGALLLATNAYHRVVPGAIRPRFATVHYSQFATDPLPPAARARILPGGEGCWDTALVMSSIRTDAAGRLILGGMGDGGGPGRVVHTAWARRKLGRMFPWLGEIGFTHSWAGRIAMTADHVPKVVAFGPRAHAIFGFSGRGISPGTVFGTAAARTLLGGSGAGYPLDPVDAYSEAFVTAKSAFYEGGAIAAHAAGLIPTDKR